MSAHQLLRGQEDDQNKHIVRHLLWHRLRTVHAVPAALLHVAALVTFAVCIVRDTIRLVHWVAKLFLSAVKVVKKAVSVVAELIALAVVEETPAARVRTASPGVNPQRAVPSVPLARVGVTFFITDAIIGFALTVCKMAGWQRRRSQSGDVLTPLPFESDGTQAVEVWEAGLLCAQSIILAGLGCAAFVRAMLTLGSSVTWRTCAARSPGSQGTTASIVARQFPTGHASLTVRTRVTQLACANVS